MSLARAYDLARKMAYDAEMAVLAVVSKSSCTFDFSKMFGSVLTRDLWHEGRECLRDPISIVIREACFPAKSISLRSCR